MSAPDDERAALEQRERDAQFGALLVALCILGAAATVLVAAAAPALARWADALWRWCDALVAAW